MTHYHEEAEIHGHWERILASWPSKQIRAVCTDQHTGVTAWFAIFLCYMLEHSEHYLLS